MIITNDISQRICNKYNAAAAEKMKYCSRTGSTSYNSRVTFALRAHVQRLKKTCHVAKLRHVF
jgi:tryptophan synthase alpha subunit